MRCAASSASALQQPGPVCEFPPIRSEAGFAEPIREQQGLKSPRTRAGSMPCETIADCWSSPQSLGVEGGARAAGRRRWTQERHRECEHFTGCKDKQHIVLERVMPLKILLIKKQSSNPSSGQWILSLHLNTFPLTDKRHKHERRGTHKKGKIKFP